MALHALVEPSGKIRVSLHDILLKEVLQRTDLPVVEQVTNGDLVAKVPSVGLTKLPIKVLKEKLNRLQLKLNLTGVPDGGRT